MKRNYISTWHFSAYTIKLCMLKHTITKTDKDVFHILPIYSQKHREILYICSREPNDPAHLVVCYSCAIVRRQEKVYSRVLSICGKVKPSWLEARLSCKVVCRIIVITNTLAKSDIKARRPLRGPHARRYFDDE